MNHSIRRILTFCSLVWAAGVVMAQHALHDLNVDVYLQEDGTGYITETRQMTVGSDGTECYIVIGNLNGSDLNLVSVTDETGVEFENEGSWDVDRSRSRKEHRCGVVEKRNGYEVCWGVGASGERTYITTYTISNLLRGYDDADGFNYMFVAKKIAPKPEHATVKIMRADGQPITDEDADTWSFRYHGTVEFVNGAIVAESPNGLDGDEAMIVMVRFNKGIFKPTYRGRGSFEEVKTRAFEGSDYLDDDEEGSASNFWSDVKKDPSALLTILFFLCLPLILLIKVFRVRAERKAVMKDLNWYRDVPMNGNLTKANSFMNALRNRKPDYKNVVNAGVLQLINIGALKIEDHYVEASTMRKLVGGTGKTQACFVLGPPPMQQKGVTSFIRDLYNIFVHAAGDDGILQPNEMKQWMKHHESEVISFMQKVQKSTSLKECKQNRPQVRELFGLKKFLEEFTLVDERSVQEVGLWKDYLVWATLFGIADQVRKDMMKINPEYLKMDKVMQTMTTAYMNPEIAAIPLFMSNYGNQKVAEQQRRESGSGGSSSFGGGGGFSGGGSGGGIR